jgi:hypothetical protein
VINRSFIAAHTNRRDILDSKFIGISSDLSGTETAIAVGSAEFS